MGGVECSRALSRAPRAERETFRSGPPDSCTSQPAASSLYHERNSGGITICLNSFQSISSSI